MFDIEKNGVVSILRSSQTINIENLDHCRRVAESVATGSSPRIVLDLSHVPLIDSAGLEWILDFRDMCIGRGGNLVLSNPSTLCRDILSVTIVGQECMVFNDLLSAIGSYA